MAFTRLCTAAQVKQHIENIETSELTDAEIETFIDQVGEQIRTHYGYPYHQVLTDTTTTDRTYFLGEIDIYAIEKAMHDETVITDPTDYTADLEKGTLTIDAGFSLTSAELRVWIIPKRFNELAALRTARFIMRLSEGFQRGDPSLNLTILELKSRESMMALPNISFFEVDGMSKDSKKASAYDVNIYRVVQDHDRNAYL